MIFKKIIYILGAIILSFDILRSNIVIKGQVTDNQSNEPIQNVNIYFINQKTGSTTNENGNFIIKLEQKPEYIIEFSHIAYESIIIKTVADQFIDVRMNEVFLQLNDIVVTGMKCEYSLQNTPVYTEVIDKNKIIKTGSESVSDILKKHAGVSHLYDPHGMFDYNLLGLDSKYILILKNGKPISGKFRDMVDLDQIMVSNVDRVEIVKGPGSSLHGSDAIGGVINIITEEISSDPAINVQLKKSFYDFALTNDNNKISQGNLYSLSFNKRHNEFHLEATALLNELVNQKTINAFGKDRINKINFDSEVYWKPKNKINEFGIIFEYFSQISTGRELLTTGYEISSNKTDIQRNMTTLDHNVFLSDKIIFNHALNKASYHRYYKQTGIDSTFMMSNIAEEAVWDYDGTLQFLLDKNTLLLGFDYFEPSYRNQRLVDTTHAFKKNGLFIQNEYAQSNDFKIVIGVRNDKYRFNNNVSPRIAVMYKPNNNYKLRFSAGKGFRAPSVMETFINFHNIDQGYIVKGNPNLHAERSLGTTINFEFSNKRNLRINGLLYNNYFDDKILTEQVNNIDLSSTVFTYKNISSATYRGLELFTDYVYSNSFSVKFNINFRNNIDSQGSILNNSIPLSTQSELNYILEALKLKIHLVYSSNKRHSTNSSFSILDIFFKRNFTNKIKIGLGINNITNYSHKLYGPFRGRSIAIEIST